MTFREKEVTIQSGAALKGTLCLPVNHEEKTPAVLIITGSGKLDRNGKVNKKLDLKLYRQLAEYLTSIGFISLRYDKRGVAASEGDFLTTGLWDLVDDAQAAIKFLKDIPEVDDEKIIVLGHSEGAAIGTALAAREDLGGLILLSGAVETLGEALKRQRDIATEDMINANGFQGFLLRLLGAHKKVEKQAQKFLKKILSSTDDVMKQNFVKINAKWMREHLSYNVREDLAKVTCPVLAITGARDIQANPTVLKDLPLYVKGDAQYFVVENMGHSCKYITKASTIFSIKKDLPIEAELPVHPELLKLLASWLSGHYVRNPKVETVIL
ncbi:alpha/beta hydrolase [Paenibacillus sp. BSR1-1]|uniref:alpha/beta hydrolase n=1 Tax=Paenibacillus sp. BSR1-1 TaxID=3020845 RepID=UPI0025B0496E|nr:alpha/beta hydrolase [Paenibacillus sp. BSR1-1]MDN3018685.1 alpha/beta hydrolase [Paenibacillus sp. BSR1-1]